MMLALKLHLNNHIHQVSSNPFSSIVRSQQAPLFQVQPIQTSSLSPLHLNLRRKSLKGFSASYLEGLQRSNNNGGGGGGVADHRKERGGDGGGGGGASEVVRLFIRFAELLLGSDREIVGAVGLPGKLALLCVQAMWQLHLAMIEIVNVFVMVTCVGVVFMSAVITFLLFQFV